MKSLAAFASGLLFATGLIVSGMTQPANVMAFLDVFGSWNPSLAFVMAGALTVYALLYPIVTRRKTPLLAHDFQIPTHKNVDSRLFAGAAAFGVGWGMMGTCPGPALTIVGTGALVAGVFTLSMCAAIKLLQLAGPTRQSSDDSACG